MKSEDQAGNIWVFPVNHGDSRDFRSPGLVQTRVAESISGLKSGRRLVHARSVCSLCAPMNEPLCRKRTHPVHQIQQFIGYDDKA